MVTIALCTAERCILWTFFPFYPPSLPPATLCRLDHSLVACVYTLNIYYIVFFVVGDFCVPLIGRFGMSKVTVCSFSCVISRSLGELVSNRKTVVVKYRCCLAFASSERRIGSYKKRGDAVRVEENCCSVSRMGLMKERRKKKAEAESTATVVYHAICEPKLVFFCLY